MSGNYRIDVKDFGPIGHGSIDVRPFTVLIGPSNTGKSWFATLLYAIHRSLSGDMRALPLDSEARAAQAEPVAESLGVWSAKADMEDRLPDVPRDVGARIRAILASPDDLCASLTQELRRCFAAADIEELVRRAPTGDANASIGLNTLGDDGAPQTCYQFRLEGGEAQCAHGDIPEIKEIPRDLKPRLRDELAFIAGFHDASWEILRREERVSETDSVRGAHDGIERRDIDRLSDIFTVLTNTLYGWRLNPLRRNAYFLPADRTGAVHSFPVVTSSLLHSVTAMGARRSPYPALSGVLADFFDSLVRLSRASDHTESPADPAGTLENNLLGGSVRVDGGQTNYPVIAYRPKGWDEDLPMMRASSMVTELAPVALYLRYLVEPGDVLIIEEPEAHLHPAMQTDFARELARLVRSGVRIVVTTHSDWFLEQIGNLVRMSGLPRAKQQGIAGADAALEPDSVGAWFFQPKNGGNGSVAEEILLDPQTGLYPTGYEAVSEALYNDGATIFNRLQDNIE